MPKTIQETTVDSTNLHGNTKKVNNDQDNLK